MLVSLKWLREYVDLPPDLDVDELAHRLTMASAEVEAIHRVGGWDRELVAVGEVLSVDPHPNLHPGFSPGRIILSTLALYRGISGETAN